MILTNKSQTALFAGVKLTSYGLLAEFALVTQEAPERLALYRVPLTQGAKPLGVYKLDERPLTTSAFINKPLRTYQTEEALQ